jgi:hypothetical protein
MDGWKEKGGRMGWMGPTRQRAGRRAHPAHGVDAPCPAWRRRRPGAKFWRPAGAARLSIHPTTQKEREKKMVGWVGGAGSGTRQAGLARPHTHTPRVPLARRLRSPGVEGAGRRCKEAAGGGRGQDAAHEQAPAAARPTPHPPPHAAALPSPPLPPPPPRQRVRRLATSASVGLGGARRGGARRHSLPHPPLDTHLWLAGERSSDGGEEGSRRARATEEKRKKKSKMRGAAPPSPAFPTPPPRPSLHAGFTLADLPDGPLYAVFW